MANQKKKKKKNTAKQTPKPVEKQSTPKPPEPPKPKQPLNLDPLKTILPIALFVIAAAGILYLLLGRTVSVSNKRNQLKEMNVILFTLDTLRADFVGVYPNSKAETPYMKDVADDGVVFDTCIAQTPLTLPSHTSILSGTYPVYHQVRDNGGFLVPESLEFVSEAMKKQGYTTSAFIASYVLHSKWGVNQGFDFYSDDFDLSKYERISLGNVQKRADVVLKDARKWIADNKDKKFFSWIHLYDPHTPYDPPSPFKEKYAKRPYLGEVEYMDQELGMFFDFLKREGLYDNSLIILTSDHGESLGQHGESTHGFFIYEPTIRAPLIIRAPFGFPNKRVDHVVELIDLAPTILDAAGAPIPPSYQGQSLLNLMFGDKEYTKTTGYTETYYPRMHYGWSELKAFYYNKTWKYILAPKQELYDLKKDFNEKDNLALKQSGQARRTKDRLMDFIKKQSIGARKPGETSKLSQDDMQKLAALGYLTTFVNTTGKTDLPDPKGKVHVFNNLADAKKLLREEKFDEAIEILQGVIKENPQIVDGILQLGNVYSKNKMYKEAMDCFYRVLDQKPDYHAAMVNVVNALISLGELDKGIVEAQRFLKTFPKDHGLRNEMGTIYFLQKKYDKALEVFKESIEIEAVNPQAFNRIGGIYVIQKDLEKAEEYLNKAKAINVTLRRLYFNLAQIEEARGNIEQAMVYYQKELDNYPESYKAAYNLAEELRKKGRGAEALDYYRKSMEANPSFNIPYFMIAKFHLDRKTDLDHAVELCEKGVVLKPFNKYTAFGYYILADIASYHAEPAKAQDYLRKAAAMKQTLTEKGLWD